MSIEAIRRNLRAAREVNPTNDWLLARMVAASFIILCLMIIILKA